MSKQLKIILFIFLTGVSPAMAQQKGPVKKPGITNKANPVKTQVGIQAVYSVKNNKIKIRWAPVNEESWRMGNKYGYIIERRTLVKDGTILPAAEQIKSFRSYPCIKDSLPYWDSLINRNDNAAVMAQALFGDSFELDINNSAVSSGKGASMLKKAEENKQRFLFGSMPQTMTLMWHLWPGWVLWTLPQSSMRNTFIEYILLHPNKW